MQLLIVSTLGWSEEEKLATNFFCELDICPFFYLYLGKEELFSL